MPGSANPLPSRLAIFVTDPDTGRPVPRLPLFAEVTLPRRRPIPPVDQRLREVVRGTVFSVDPDLHDPLLGQVESAILDAIAAVLDADVVAGLVDDIQSARVVIELIAIEMLNEAGVAHFGEVERAALSSLAETGAERAAARLELLTRAATAADVSWSDPLGVLTTDHAGYVSYDLRRLRPDVQFALAAAIDAIRQDPDAAVDVLVRVHPYGSNEIWEVLRQARFAFDAVVGRFSMVWHTLPPALINMGPRALQDPSLTDWRLSPASFAASPRLLVGEDQTEELIPANLALQEFVLRQVVRLADQTGGWTVPAGMKAAYVDDYKVTWSSLGHSLGEILYSLPLAPAETVRLAVIDWSWSSDSARVEDTSVTEELLHQTHRDRSIVETVKAGLRELQHGSSFMGGMASSAGASGGANLGVVGLGAAVGNAWSLGGSTATSEGSRDLAAENVQRLSDAFSQASSSRRALNSTVVIQARQEESESIQTRTFSNYNHSHTLTVLYYEVLRHYRVTVEWVRRRPAALIKGTPTAATITIGQLMQRRYLIQPNLLDVSLAATFDAAGRRALGEKKFDRAVAAWNASAVTDDPGLKVFVKFAAQFTTTDDDTTEPVFVAISLKNGQAFEYQFDGAGDEGTSPEFEKNLTVPTLWRDLKDVTVKLKDVNSGGDWEVTNVLITMITSSGERVSVIAWTGAHTLDDAGGSLGPLPTAAPPPATTTHAGAKPNRADHVSVEDDLAAESLLDHIHGNSFYYDRLLWLTEQPGAIASRFEGQPWDGVSNTADHVVPDPLETFGTYVAFALARPSDLPDDSVIVDIAAALASNDPSRRAWAVEQLDGLDEADRTEVETRVSLASSRSERLITLPTRGVFAEGKLGHANVSEEIDNTRFWKWEEHPIPIEAPEIGTVVPVQPTPQAVTVAPTPMPASLVNIVNPTSAPDPTGLASVLSAITTPNIFRDMSGRQEVASLLQKLSDNTIAIAEAANKAREIQAKYGTDLGKQANELELGKTQADVDIVKELGRQRKEAAQEVTPSQAKDAIDLSASETRKGNKTPEQHAEYSNRVQQNVPGAKPSRKSKSSIRLQIDLKGFADQLLIGRFGVTVKQRGADVGFLLATDYSKEGQLIVNVGNEWDDPRYSIEISGEVLGGLGVNSQLRGRTMVQIPREDFDKYDYFYFVASAQVDTFEFETTQSDEVSKEITKRIGGSLGAEVPVKGVAISATAEGGVDWNDGQKHTVQNAVKVKVVYYPGGFTVAYAKGA